MRMWYVCNVIYGQLFCKLIGWFVMMGKQHGFKKENITKQKAFKLSRFSFLLTSSRNKIFVNAYCFSTHVVDFDEKGQLRHGPLIYTDRKLENNSM